MKLSIFIIRHKRLCALISALLVLALLFSACAMIFSVCFEVYELSPKNCVCTIGIYPDEYCDINGLGMVVERFVHARTDRDGNLILVLTEQQKMIWMYRAAYIFYVMHHIKYGDLEETIVFSQGDPYAEIVSEFKEYTKDSIFSISQTYHEKGMRFARGAKGCGIVISDDFATVTVPHDANLDYIEYAIVSCVYMQTFAQKRAEDVKVKCVFLNEDGGTRRVNTWPQEDIVY